LVVAITICDTVRLVVKLSMTAMTAPPARQRFGGLRRMLQAARRKGVKTTDIAAEANASPSPPSPVESQRGLRQQEEKPAPLEIMVIADAATPAAPLWQLRNNSVFSPIEVRSLSLLVSCCRYCSQRVALDRCCVPDASAPADQPAPWYIVHRPCLQQDVEPCRQAQRSRCTIAPIIT
jgi:hypothetical protein